jgi:hypothetical protein
MDVTHAIDPVIGFVGFFSVVWLVFVAWPKLVVDYARQHIFETRDRLFDLAASGDVSFQSDEYKEIRQFLNGMIRCAERATCLNYARYSMIIEKNKVPLSSAEVKRFISMMKDVKTPEAIREAYRTTIAAYDYLLILRTPLLWVLAPPLLLLWFLAYFFLYKDTTTEPISSLKHKRDVGVQADMLRELDRTGLLAG